ncbi:GAF domain-containing protein [Deinococcus alpinitundrae]|uniref:GAF domain-containing protein n=1 Tax=Deinococcus alpinitundrae TaxID=468913 RepID=UPI00137B8E23|nr:GAF domain-containing protein [Deinococcus alpinitundrae]
MISPLGSTDSESFSTLADYIQEITQSLAAASTEREVIEIVLTPAVQALGAVAGIVLLANQNDQQMKIAGSQGYEDVTRTIWQEGSLTDNQLIADILRMHEALYFEHAGALKAAYPEIESRTGALAAVANATLPMFLDQQPLGVIVLDFSEPHDFTPAERRFLTILSNQCAVALGRAEATRALETRVENRTRDLEERTRQLEEERAAQAAFVTFAEAVGSQAELLTLAREAIKVLQGRFPGASAVYYEEEQTLWKGHVWSDNMRSALIEVISVGLPSDTPLFAQVIQSKQPVFTDGWDPQRERVASSEDYHAAANYPLLIGGELRSILSIGLRKTHTWNDADRALFRAVGRSLNLALERTEMARQLMTQNAELQARTQALSFANEELAAFSYSVSHDLRTPVRHMLGFLQLTRTTLNDRLDEKSTRYLDVVEQAGRQMNSMIDALLDLSHAAQQPLRPQLVDLNTLMEEIWKGLLPDLLTRNVQWEVVPLPLVQGDWDALKQVLIQLTENALKFTRTRDPAIIRIWAQEQGETWKVYVQDNGLGFDPRYQERLFNVFQRLHSDQEVPGTGVGLASVRRLILKHGGEVFAEGQVDQGATFGFILPKSGPTLQLIT